MEEWIFLLNIIKSCKKFKKDNMKLLHVINEISPQSGGPTRSVKGLCRALSKAGCDTTLFVLNGNHEFDNPCGVKVVRDRMPNITNYDLVHIHGLWLWGIHKVMKECVRCKVRYVISPRGMLDPWALSVKRWKKSVAMALYQRGDLTSAVAFHVTAALEEESVRKQGLKQKVIVAPNGVDIPASMPPRRVLNGTKTALFLSRLHPGKGLLTLAEAWSRVRPKGWRMKVVGPDFYGHKNDVVEALFRLGIRDDWEFVDALDDVKKWEAYRSADLLAHPSVSENFGITIAEGLAAELPVICTKGTPWSVVEERKCGWWIDVGVEPLANALHEAMTLSDADRQAMGSCGRKLVEEKYTWDAVVMDMVKGYEEVLNGRA